MNDLDPALARVLSPFERDGCLFPGRGDIRGATLERERRRDKGLASEEPGAVRADDVSDAGGARTSGTPEPPSSREVIDAVAIATVLVETYGDGVDHERIVQRPGQAACCDANGCSKGIILACVDIKPQCIVEG